MTHPANTISSDLRSPRTGIPIDEEGTLSGIEIKIDGKAHTIVYGDRGGVAVVAAPLDVLMRPTAEEGGISRRLQDVLRKLADVEVDGFDPHEGTLIDKLEAAIAEFSEYARNIRPDLRSQQAHVGELEAELAACCRMALDRTTSSAFTPEMVRWQAAISEVEKLAALCLSWQDGARVLFAEGLVEVGAGAGAGEFFGQLRLLLVNSKATQEALEGQVRRDTAALNQTRSELDRMRIDLDHYREEARGATAQRVEELSVEVARLTGELAAKDADWRRAEASVKRLEAQIDGALPPAKDITATATEAATTVLDTLTPPAPGAAPHKARAHMPGAGILRVIVAADVGDDVLAHVELAVNEAAAEFVETISVEREPGTEPEGYRIEGGEDGGQPAYVWHHVALQEAGHTEATKAAAIDGAWTAYAEGLSE